ncbi:NADH-flavin reductase [Kribbella turkmenica]|uniref:NADH-flavin reductase n=1 Tax=Kribbella turkmenica TaxID=2530375 RepID=A0A4R4WRC0_9ACTN|nr:NAD(P)H-binding protein [Kribbella turkmenica]TDD17880.1 NADH-flavin reductase [Kribbella turkmenica]
MGKILVIGARGRAARAAIAEARSRGHHVTPIARTTGPAADVVAGDVTDAGRIRELAAGHDAVIAAVYDGGTDPAVFYPAAARALVGSLADVRLIWVGLASLLPGRDGTPLMDTPGYPQEHRAFYLAHQAALDTFAASTLDWVSLAPAGDFNHADPRRTGSYRLAPGDPTTLTSYADFAIALLDEYEQPRHHRQVLGVV